MGFGCTCLKQAVLARHVQLTQEVEEDAAGDTLAELGNAGIQHGVLNLIQSHILAAIQEPPEEKGFLRFHMSSGLSKKISSKKVIDKPTIQASKLSARHWPKESLWILERYKARISNSGAADLPPTTGCVAK